MRVTILGCGASAGVPHLGGVDGKGDWGACDPSEPRNRRTRSSIVVESGQGGRLLVDTGPDMRAQLLACGIPRIDAVLFTHAHADHITGMDDIRMLNRVSGRPIPAFATPHTLGELTRRFDYAFKPWTPPGFFRPVLEATEFQYGEIISTAGLHLHTFEQDHGFSSTVGFRTGAFAYSTDVVRLPDAAFEILAGVETWVVDCFQRRSHNTHADIDVVCAWATKVGARRTILTHMGPDLDWAWMQQRLPAGMEPGWDGLVLDCDGA